MNTYGLNAGRDLVAAVSAHRPRDADCSVSFAPCASPRQRRPRSWAGAQAHQSPGEGRDKLQTAYLKEMHNNSLSDLCVCVLFKYARGVKQK